MARTKQTGPSKKSKQPAAPRELTAAERAIPAHIEQLFGVNSIHTAKCDCCDRKNKDILRVCEVRDCGWKICLPCIQAKQGNLFHNDRCFPDYATGQAAAQTEPSAQQPQPKTSNLEVRRTDLTTTTSSVHAGEQDSSYLVPYTLSESPEALVAPTKRLLSVSDESEAGNSASQPPAKRARPVDVSQQASGQVRRTPKTAIHGPYISGSHVVPSKDRTVSLATPSASTSVKMSSRSKRNAQSPAPGDVDIHKVLKRNKPVVDEDDTELDDVPEYVPKRTVRRKPAPANSVVPTATSTKPPRMTANSLSTASPATVASAITLSKPDLRHVRDAEGCTRMPVPGRPLKDQKAKTPAGATDSEIESDLAEMRKGMPPYTKAGWKTIESDVEEHADQTDSGHSISSFGPGLSAERFTLTEEWESQRKKLPRRQCNNPIANADLAPRPAKPRAAEAAEGSGTAPSHRPKRPNPYPACLAVKPEALEARRKQVLEQGHLTPTGIRNRLRRVDEEMQALQEEKEALGRQQSAHPETFQELREKVSTFVGPLTFGKRTAAGFEEMLRKVDGRLSVLQNQQEQLQGHRDALRRDKAKLEREEQAPCPSPDPVQSVMGFGQESPPWPLPEGTYWSDRDKPEGGLRTIPGYEEKLTSAQQKEETMSVEQTVEDDLMKDLGDEDFDLPKVWGDYQWE